MPANEIVLLGVNHRAPFESNRVNLKEVNKAVAQLKNFAKPGQNIGFDLPHFRIELFELYGKALRGKLPEKFNLPKSMPWQERASEKMLLDLMNKAAEKYGLGKAREVLAKANPDKMYYFELCSRAKKLGFRVTGVVPARTDEIIERIRNKTKKQDVLDLAEIGLKEKEMAEFIASMKKKPKIIVTGIDHVAGKGLDLQLLLKGINSRIIPIGAPRSRQMLYRNSMARIRFDNRVLERFFKARKQRKSSAKHSKPKAYRKRPKMH